MVLAQLHEEKRQPFQFQLQVQRSNDFLAAKPKPILFTVSRQQNQPLSLNLRRPTDGASVPTGAMDRVGVLRKDDDVVIKSPNDQRSYRILHLTNGLFVLLVHDPEIYSGIYPSQMGEGSDVEMGEEPNDDGDMEEDEDEEMNEHGPERRDKKNKGDKIVKKATAAMYVRSGNSSDPLYAQGLSHLLEHMLFLGSSEFSDYDSFLARHGGSTNATTEFEHSIYYLDVKREFLKGALKRFSDLFTSPLLHTEAMDGELMVVDSEFNQVVQVDECRLLQIQCSTTSPRHPLNRFLWGNQKSISNAVQNGVKMREEMLKLFTDNYHAGNMKLVVIGGEPLEILEDWVVQLFSKVKKSPKMEVNVRNDTQLQTWEPAKLYKLESVQDRHVLQLTWTMPCLHKEYLKKPDEYFSLILGYEGKGSILYLLKEKGWATSLSAGVDDILKFSFAFLFSISIQLSDAGLDKMYEVIGVVYQYIKLLVESKPQEWIFKELQDMGNLNFRFAEEQPQSDYACELAEHAFYYNDKHIICGSYIFEEWDPALIEHILGFFVPHNMRVDLITQSFDKDFQDVQVEPWFGSRYTIEEIPQNILEAWGNPCEVDAALHLPVPNEFIPANFTLRNSNIPKPIGNVNPICIIDQPFMKIWYKMDFTFNVPRANTYFWISLKDAYKTVKNCVMAELFVNLLKDELDHVIFQAGQAKLETSLSIFEDKIALKLNGYNDKLPLLLEKILSLAKNFSPSVDRFKAIKEDLERSYRNTNMTPSEHSANLRAQLLIESFCDVNDKLLALIDLSLSDLSSFIPHLFSQLYVEGLCHGNLSKEEVINIANIFTNTLSAKPLPEDSKHHKRIICVEPGAKLVMSVPVKNQLEPNSIVDLCYEIEVIEGRKMWTLNATLDLVCELIYSDFFTCLRTREQLGYNVVCWTRKLYFAPCLCFQVQSAKYSPSYLHARIENFINRIGFILQRVSEENFEHLKTGYIAHKLQKEPSLSSETDSYCSQITSKRYMFDEQRIEAEEMRTIRKDDVIRFCNIYLRPDSAKCRRIAYHVRGCNVDSTDVAKLQQRNWKLIDDPVSFKQSSKFYPWSIR